MMVERRDVVVQIVYRDKKNMGFFACIRRECSEGEKSGEKGGEKDLEYQGGDGFYRISLAGGALKRQYAMGQFLWRSGHGPDGGG